MAKIKCEYCGEYYDEEIFQSLENGSPACPKCVAEEDEKQKKEKD